MKISRVNAPALLSEQELQSLLPITFSSLFDFHSSHFKVNKENKRNETNKTSPQPVFYSDRQTQCPHTSQKSPEVTHSSLCYRAAWEALHLLAARAISQLSQLLTLAVSALGKRLHLLCVACKVNSLPWCLIAQQLRCHVAVFFTRETWAHRGSFPSSIPVLGHRHDTKGKAVMCLHSHSRWVTNTRPQ